MEPAFGVESPAFVAIRALLSACSIGLVGAFCLRWAVLARYAGPDAEELRAAVDRRLPAIIDVLAIAAVLATLARFAAQHAAVFGASEPWTRDSVGALLVRSDWGRGWWLALTTAVFLTWLAPRLRRGIAVGWWLAAAAALAFAASGPLSGHPAASDAPTRGVAAQLAHLLGAGGWIGGLALLTVVAIPTARGLTDGAQGDADGRIAGLVRAFSPTALVFSALLALSGLYTAWMQLGGLERLWQSAYGRTLMLKLGLLSIAVLTGAYNWRRVLPALGTPSSSARLRRSSLIELTAAALVLVVTAVLVATPMPGD